MKSKFLFFAIVVLFSNSFAQTTAKSKQFIIPKAATVNVSNLKEDWNPVLQNIEAPKPDANSEKIKLQQIKDSLQKVYPKKNISNITRESRGVLPTPFLGKNFQGNGFTGGLPCDNEIAISDSGKIISVMNSSVFSYNTNTNSLISNVSLDNFGTSLGVKYSKYDPKVIYDPDADKFIVLYLNGYTDTATLITVAFSQTSDPGGSWNLYTLPGNPLNNGLWTYYPMVAMTDKEVFITGNLLYPDSSWQTGFNESIIWQIDKAKGYNGQTLLTQLHHNIKFNGKNVRNLCPVKGGSDIYGPDMHFLSNRNFAAQNDTVFLIRINDTINAPGQTLTVNALISNNSYFMPPDVAQPGTFGQTNNMLQTNDARILGAYLENNQIQFVSNTLDTAKGFGAVYHGIINNVNSTPALTATIITDTLLELGYPNISYIGKKGNLTDKRSCISFNHSAATVMPGVSAMIADDAGNYSPIITVKKGVNFSSFIAGNERWGDYTGSQRRYNDTAGVVWVNGMFAINPSAITKNIRTWVGEIKLVSLTGIENFENEKNITDINLFPNPTSDIISVEINLTKPEVLFFEIYDMNGKFVKLLLNDKVKAGKNLFSFSTAPLSGGMYILKVRNTQTEFTSKRIVKN